MALHTGAGYHTANLHSSALGKKALCVILTTFLEWKVIYIKKIMSKTDKLIEVKTPSRVTEGSPRGYGSKRLLQRGREN